MAKKKRETFEDAARRASADDVEAALRETARFERLMTPQKRDGLRSVGERHELAMTNDLKRRHDLLWMKTQDRKGR